MDVQELATLISSAATAIDAAAAAHLLPLLLLRLEGHSAAAAAGGRNEDEEEQRELCGNQEVIGGLLQLLFATAVWKDEHVLGLLLPVVEKVMGLAGKETMVRGGWAKGIGGKKQLGARRNCGKGRTRERDRW